MLKHGKSEIGKAGLRSINRKSGTQEFETGVRLTGETFNVQRSTGEK
jgi:hypothetical protein